MQLQIIPTCSHALEQNNSRESIRSQCRRKTSWLHVILTLLLIEFAFLFRRCILVLLILGDKVVHIAFGFRELHLVHTLTCVPVEECLAAKHCREVLSHTLEHL